MQRLSLLIIFFLAGHIFVNAQKNKPAFEEFKDRQTGLYGVKNKTTGNVIRPAIYDWVIPYNDTFALVSKGALWGYTDYRYDYLADTVVTDMDMFQCFGNDSLGYLWGYDYTGRKFAMNRNCDCVPRQYYTCPYGVSIDTSNTPLSFRLLQRAEYANALGNIEMAIYWVDEAIKADPNEESFYFWKATTFNQGYIGAHLWDVYAYYSTVQDFLSRAEKSANSQLKIVENALENTNDENTQLSLNHRRDSLEKQLTRIGRLSGVYYSKQDTDEEIMNPLWDEIYYSVKEYVGVDVQDSLMEKGISYSVKGSPDYYDQLGFRLYLGTLPVETKRAYKKEIRENVSLRHRRNGAVLYAVGGYLYKGDLRGSEVSLGFGIRLDEPPAFLSWLFGGGHVYYSVGYEQYYHDLNTHAYHFSLNLQYIASLSVRPMLIRSDERKGFGTRFEVGTSLQWLSVNYGYTLASKSKFGEIRGHSLIFRVAIPAFTFRSAPYWRFNNFF